MRIQYDFRGQLTGVFVEADVHKEWEWRRHREHWDPIDVRGDKWDKLTWGYYDYIVTYTKDTILSQLAKFTGKVGDIGGGLGVLIKRIPGYNASMTVAAFIGTLEKTLKTTESIRIGYVWMLEEINTEWRNIHRIPFGCICPE